MRRSAARALGLGQLLAPHGELLQLGGGLVDGGLHLQQAGRPGGAAVREVRAEHVAFGGHGGQLGARGDEVLGVLQGGDDDDVPYEAAYGGHQGGGAADEVGYGGGGGGDGSVRPRGSARTRGRRARTPYRRVRRPAGCGRGQLRSLVLRAPRLAALPRYVARPDALRRAPAQQQRRPARVLLAQQPDRLGGRGGVGHGDRVRRRAEGGGDRRPRSRG